MYCIMYLNMKNINPSQLQPISNLPRNYSDLADEVQRGEEIIFLKRSSPYVVFMNFERWQALMELEKEYYERKALADLENSEAEYAAGEVNELISLADL